jgi:hypothetical protein
MFLILLGPKETEHAIAADGAPIQSREQREERQRLAAEGLTYSPLRLVGYPKAAERMQANHRSPRDNEWPDVERVAGEHIVASLAGPDVSISGAASPTRGVDARCRCERTRPINDAR